MSTDDESREEGNSSASAVLGALAVIAFAFAILCLVLFVVFA